MGLITTAVSLITAASALSPVTIKGNAFYNGSDSRFYIRGVDYQPGGSSNVTDPLADSSVCKRDISHFTDLGINTIRVYTVDNSANHDECMQALEDAGIYLLLDVNTPKQSLNRYDNSSLKLSYNSGYLQHVFATIDAFKDYPNTLGFFAANEVINDWNTTIAAPYIKAVVRDMKAYIKAQSNRTIPVGYSAADIADSRWQQMTYLNCGDDEGSRIDMFGMNDYSWCGEASSFQQSGWANNVQTYSNYSIPLFMSEYGCNKVMPRTFPEVKSLYSSDMSPVYSGGLVYEYSSEANNYGLVDVDGDDVTELQDYQNFKKALANAPSPSGDGGAKSSGSASDCPAYESNVWDVEPDAPVPDMPKYAQSYLKNGAGKPLGLNGPGTQSGSQLDIDGGSSSASSSGASSSSAAGSSSAASSSAASSSATSSSGSSSSSSSSSSGSSSASSTSSASSSASTAGKKKNGAVEHTPGVGLGSILLGLALYI